jgi:hypothetical protein
MSIDKFTGKELSRIGMYKTFNKLTSEALLGVFAIEDKVLNCPSLYRLLEEYGNQSLIFNEGWGSWDAEDVLEILFNVINKIYEDITCPNSLYGGGDFFTDNYKENQILYGLCGALRAYGSLPSAHCSDILKKVCMDDVLFLLKIKYQDCILYGEMYEKIFFTRETSIKEGSIQENMYDAKDRLIETIKKIHKRR